MNKQSNSIFVIFFAIVFLSFADSSAAQIRENNTDVEKLRQSFKQAENHFRTGLAALNINQPSKAREDFDRSVEVFLTSSASLSENRGLRQCYDQLVETIYRIEFPSKQKAPNIQRLSAACNWNIESQLIDGLTTFEPTAGSDSRSADNSRGFTEQKFEPSPLDELARLELTEQEKQIDGNPVAQQQYELIQIVAANRSLGLSFRMHPMVQQYINYYRGRGRATMETGLYRSGMFMLMARRIFREEAIPENVVWLGQVESTWKPTARSWAAASGLWQFIPGTGSRFGLRMTSYLDERNSFEKATRASARYLKFLANRYGGNWELAMAAYNCGEGNVDRAIRRAGVADFWAAYAYLPTETRNYVPNILATILIANDPNTYGFGHVRPASPLQYDTVRVSPLTDLRAVARSSNTSVEHLRYLNPELRTNMTPPEPYLIRVPTGKIGQKLQSKTQNNQKRSS